MKLPEVANLTSIRALCSEDVEIDFFNNIIHLQVISLHYVFMRFYVYENIFFFFSFIYLFFEINKFCDTCIKAQLSICNILPCNPPVSTSASS